MTARQIQPRRQIWLLAFLLTLLLHGGAILGIRQVGVGGPPLVRAQEPVVVQMVFAPEPPAPAEDPTFFTELPPDRAEEPPRDPDFLSNVDSRARDETPSGEAGSMPHLEGRSDFPQIRLETGDAGVPETVENPPFNSEPADDASPEEEDARSRLIRTSSGVFADRPSARPEESVVPRTRAAAPPMEGEHGAPKLSDISQEEISSFDTNADLFGGISLNTKAWDFAPWLMSFRRDFLDKWVAPLGYQLGWIHGRNTLELEIAPSGELLRCDVIAQSGHSALSSASVWTAKAAAPYQALPPDFPEPTLLLRLTLDYPDFRH